MHSLRSQLWSKPCTIAVVLIITLLLLVYHMQSTDRFMFNVFLEHDNKYEKKVNKVRHVSTEMLILEKPVDLASISCHYSTEGDALPSAEAAGFAPAPGSIYFHETSCRGGLNSRQACAVESAARAHPHRRVHVLFSAPVTAHVLETSCLARLRRLYNVDFLRVHEHEYTKGTPVESTLAKVKASRYPMEHFADIIRIVTLYKWGGVYLDGDVVVLKSFESLPLNWIAKESNGSVASGIMSFMKDEVGSNLTGAVLEEISSTYDPQSWSYNGPFAILRVLKRMCPDVTNSSLGNCNGITIFEPDLFYPIYYESAAKYFEPGDVDMEGPYTHHVWNKITRDSRIGASSPYAKLAKRFCPTIYEAFGDKFGV